MPKVTIDDLVNIGVGYGGLPDTPDARERYKAVLRAESRATVAAAKGSTFRLPGRPKAPVAAQAAPQAPAPAAPAAPTEYPGAWKQTRRVAAGVRVDRKAARITTGRD